ncbi:L-glyceraldehyde 3-phosphate reductase [Nonomuraea coxensis DSM 45129]|uniref:L-glyceraldehyde 3-phosphate reductase n=1 Tax=Nonomuraea coxensis DSM 45129 TaxID=1122611 RepID=A0ABX8U7C9_9ACTN|nr:aldo/keto reductase [Nonomuraea coxensis]QYC43331.1 L-glyceraldehyde 3-phosphate reductase [Nonomuraea coxensis DSM 45129]
MDYTRLGGTGLRVSRVCLGMMSYGDPARQDWALPQDEAEPIIRRAADAGVTFFDTADMYSRGESEVVTGNVLRAIFPRREDYVLATKVYFPMSDRPNDGGLSRKHIMAGIDASLRRLGTDHVDLYQIHRWDPETPIEETMEALHDVVRAGKVRYLGASSMSAWQFAKAQHVAELNGWTKFVSMQPHYNLLYREEEREMLPLCLDQGVGVIPWSPLARGVLARAGAAASTARAGSDARIEALYDPENDKVIVDRVARVAADRGLPAAQVALAWLLHQPAVTAPIVGATKDRHVDDAVAAVDVRLSEEELAFLAEPYRPRDVRF